MEVPSRFDLRHVRFEGKPAVRGHRKTRGRRGIAVATFVADSRAVDAPSEGLTRWLLARAGLDASLYRSLPLRRRLPACLRILKVRGEEQARTLLDEQPELVPLAISSLLIGVTEFFRDSAVFKGLQARVLPELAGRTRLRVWSAGCSSGEELLSVAIFLAEADLLDGTFLLGTDCRPDAVAQAEAALYREDDLAVLPAAIRQKYFEPADDCWRPVSQLRRSLHWKVADLGRGVEKGPWDIVLWRNMAIYLNPEPAVRVWTRLAAELAEGGFLLVGQAERPPARLGLAPLHRCIYRNATFSKYGNTVLSGFGE